MAEPIAFSGLALDRAADRRRRDEAWLAEQASDPEARAVHLDSAGVLAPGGRLALRPLAEEERDGAVLLGVDERGSVWAVDDDPHPGEAAPAVPVAGGQRRGQADPPEDGDRLDLRSAAATLPAGEAGLTAYAASLLSWHRGHAFCPNCGSATDRTEGGLSRACPRCGASHHPRVDPVAIMLVHRGDEVLLGRQARWPAGRYSALAGFVGPGESLEETVAREVHEEAGVTIGAPEYVASQPWPFPSSLMLGFLAPAPEREDLGGSDDELEDVRWFRRDEVADAAENTPDSWLPAPGAALALPPRTAIARRLIDTWLERSPS